MNSNIFSVKRFSDFFPVELICLRKRQILYSIVMIGILTLFAILNSIGGDYLDQNWLRRFDYDPVMANMVKVYFIFLFVFGTMSASLMWSEMKDKQGRIYTLMNPATTFEKFLAKFIVYVIAFLVIYLLGVFIAETVRYLIFSNVYPDAGVTPLYLSFSYPKETFDMIWVLSSVDKPVLFFLCLYLMIQSFFVLGSSIWPNRSFIKTFLVFGCITAAYLIIIFKTASELSEGKTGDPSWIREHSYAVFYSLTITITLVNWTLAYFRIPETDVITTKR